MSQAALSCRRRNRAPANAAVSPSDARGRARPAKESRTLAESVVALALPVVQLEWLCAGEISSQHCATARAAAGRGGLPTLKLIVPFFGRAVEGGRRVQPRLRLTTSRRRRPNRPSRNARMSARKYPQSAIDDSRIELHVRRSSTSRRRRAYSATGPSILASHVACPARRRGPDRELHQVGLDNQCAAATFNSSRLRSSREGARFNRPRWRRGDWQ